jgi:RimJ/RimL family protein N-acetyltransferase
MTDALDAGRLPGGPFARGVIEVRRWREDDAQAANQAVLESREHLRPWMPWADAAPDTLEERQQRIAGWERDWLAGGDGFYGIFVDGRVAGGCGLHRRLGPDGLEIGYWLHAAFTGRGVMTSAAAMLTGAAFTVPGVSLVEIHHDRANVRSAGVPRRLGFTLVDEVEREAQAPAEIGIECRWRMTRSRWLARSQSGGVKDLVEGGEVFG